MEGLKRVVKVLLALILGIAAPVVVVFLLEPILSQIPDLLLNILIVGYIALVFYWILILQRFLGMKN